MKKKKLIATVLSASMLVGLLAGCGSSTDPAESPTGGGETTPAQGETTPAQNDGVVPCKCSRKIPKNLLN